MQIKVKSLIFGFSLFLNGLFVLLLVLASFSKTSSFLFLDLEDYTAAAAVISVPRSSSASVELITLGLKPGEKAHIQFSVISGRKKQANLLFTPLYDPNVVSVSQTGFGLEITALREGTALVQTLTNDGIRDVARITVEE